LACTSTFLKVAKSSTLDNTDNITYINLITNFTQHLQYCTSWLFDPALNIQITGFWSFQRRETLSALETCLWRAASAGHCRCMQRSQPRPAAR